MIVAGRFTVFIVLTSSILTCDSCRKDEDRFRDAGGPLAVVERHPLDRADTPMPLIYARFNNALATGTVGPGVLTVEDDEGLLSGTVEPMLWADRSVVGVSFTPDDALVAGRCYTATVTTDIVDRFGDRLDEDVSWTFCVDAGEFYAWHEPRTFEGDGGEPMAGRYPALVNLRALPKEHVVWLEEIPGEVEATRHIRYGRVESQVFAYRGIALEDVGDFSEPDVASTPWGDGVIVAAGRDPSDGRHGLWLRRFEHDLDTGAWSFRFAELVGDADGPVEHPRVAVDHGRDGLAVFSMTDSAGGTQGVWSVRSVSDTAWDAPGLVESLAVGELERPQLAMNSTGQAFAVWEVEHGSDSYQLRGGRFDKAAAGSGWTWTGALASGSTGVVRSPSVGVDEDANAIVLWAREEGGSSSVHALRFGAADASPPAAEELSAGLVGEARSPHVAVSPGGMAIAVWVQVVGPTEQSLMAMRYAPGEGWRDRAVVWTDTRVYDPFVAAGSAGDGIVVWSYEHVHASHYLGGTAWTAPETLSRADDFSFLVERPRVDIDWLGRATAVWAQMDYRWTIRFARYW